MNLIRKNAVMFLVSLFVLSGLIAPPVFAQEVPVADGGAPTNTPTVNPNASSQDPTDGSEAPSGSIGGNGENDPLSPPAGDDTPDGGDETSPENGFYSVETGEVVYKGVTYKSTKTYMCVAGDCRVIASFDYSLTTMEGPRGITMNGLEGRFRTYSWADGSVEFDMSNFQFDETVTLVDPETNLPYTVWYNASFSRNNSTGEEWGSGQFTYQGTHLVNGTTWPNEDLETFELIPDPLNPGKLIWVPSTGGTNTPM